MLCCFSLVVGSREPIYGARPICSTTMTDLSILHNFPQWEKLKKDLAEDPFNNELWNELVSHHEKLITDHKDLLRTRTELKKLLISDMDMLLTKFPNYISYWKRYGNMMDTLEGVKTATQILNRAIISCPYSLDLWIDYLTTLISNKLKTEKELEALFEDASSKIGYHFLGHKFWDVYFSWAKSVYGSNSNDYLNILLRVIQIPLYHYAKYSEEFDSLKGKFTITDLIPKHDLVEYIQTNNYLTDSRDEKNIDEYIESHSEELIQSYFEKVLVNTETRTQEKYKYESTLKTEFDLNMITVDELKQWSKYIDFEQDQKDRKYYLDEMIVLYERSLIPTCLSDQIWIKYARFLIHNNVRNEKIIQIFNKACDSFVPLDLKDIRYMYSKFMELRVKDIGRCKQIFMTLISECPTETEPVSKYLDLLIHHATNEEARKELVQDMINCCFKFNLDRETIEHVNKKKKTKHNKTDQKSTTLTIKNPDIHVLYYKLTFWNIGQLIVTAAKYYWLIEKDIQKTRDTLLSVFDTEVVKSSKVYWYFYFEFEKCQRNKKNLTNLISKLKVSSTLSISDINLLIEEYNSFIFKNFSITDIKQNERDIIKNILETDIESSMHMKHFLKVRLAEDNDEETINRRLVRENGHPAAICEGRPTLTNPLLVGENTFANKEIPPLPRFRNVEKASLIVKYIHESI